MAEPLKNSFGVEVPSRIADMIGRVSSKFDRHGFLQTALDGYETLELTPRARQIAAALGLFLPGDRERAIELIIDSLDYEAYDSELAGMGSFIYLPYVYFVADYGLECFEVAMRAQYELTKRFTAEFSIRAYLERHPDATLERLSEWARDPNVHVRRLVSEGTRPRLPWAPRLKRFQEDPSPVLELLELLKDDSEEYVRRSVANNLNDISKDHPGRVVGVARRWLKDGGEERKRIVRRGLRTLIKQGDEAALSVLGYGPDSPASVGGVRCQPKAVSIGGRVRIEVDVENPSQEIAPALIDLRIHFVKANGQPRPKVFKGAELELEPGAVNTVRKTISLAQHSTRKHYAGAHRIEVLLNGRVYPGGLFDLS